MRDTSPWHTVGPPRDNTAIAGETAAPGDPDILTPTPEDVTLLGKRIFADVIKLKISS